MSYHWRSSDARELFEKTVLRRVSLVVLVVLWMSPASTGRLVIDQHCLHGQYHSLFTNTTCVQSTCSRVISPDIQPYTITQEELPSTSRLSMGYSISLWIKVDTAKNYTNRHLISLIDSHGKDLWRITINGISSKTKSRTISLLIKSVLNHQPNVLLSVRLSSSKQQLATWHNVLFSFHSNGQITPYFDGFVGEHQWIPVVNSGDHHIVLGANKDKHKFNLQYKDPFVFTRPLSEADAIALQQHHHLTDGTMLYPHCLCPEGYILSSINQYLCVSGNDDQQVSRIKDDTVDTIIWPQYNNRRLKRMSDDGSDDEGSGMDSSVITSIPVTTSVVTVSSVTIGTSALITSEVEGSGEFSTILSFSEVTSSIPFTSSPVSPIPSSPIVSSTALQTSEVTQSFSATVVSTSLVSPTATSSVLVTSPIPPTESITSPTTPIFSSVAINTTTSALPSDITPSFTTSITDTVASSAIITSVVVSTSLISEPISTIIGSSLVSPTATSSVIVTSPTPSTESITSPTTPTFSSVAINTTTSVLPSDITPSFTTSITDTVASSAIITSVVVSTSLISEPISTIIGSSLFSPIATSSVIVTSPTPSTESITSPTTPTFSSVAINTTTSALPSDITPSFTTSITDTVASSAIITSLVVSTSLISEPISTIIGSSLFSPTATSSVIVTSPTPSTESITSPTTPTFSSVAINTTTSALPSDITPSFTTSITDTVASSAIITSLVVSTSLISEPISTIIGSSLFSPTATSSVIVTSPTPSTESITSPTTPTFSSVAINTTTSALPSDITPSLTMSITDTVASSAIITSVVVSTSLISEPISTIIGSSLVSPTATSSVIVTSPIPPTESITSPTTSIFSSAAINTTTSALPSDITPSFTTSITDTVASSAIITSVVVSTSLISEPISTIIGSSLVSPTATSSVIVTSPIPPTESITSPTTSIFSSAAISTTTSALRSDITPSFTTSITDTVASSAIITSVVVSTSLISEPISTIIGSSLVSPTATSSVLVTSPIPPTESITSPTTSIFSSAAINTTTSALPSDITPSFTTSITDTVASSANITSAVVSTSLISEPISTIVSSSLVSLTATSSVLVTSPIPPTTSLELFTSTSMSSVTVSPTLETTVSVVSTQSLAVTVTPTSSFTIAPTMITPTSVTELTSVSPLPTPSISSSIEIGTSTELSTQMTSFTVLPTTPSTTGSEFISPSPTTMLTLDTSISSIVTIPTISSAITNTTASPTSITNLTTILFTSDTEFTPTTIPSFSSSLMNSTTEIVPTMITSVLTSETLLSTDVTSSFEITFTSSIEASPTTIGSLSTITSSFENITPSTIEVFPTMTSSNITGFTPTPSFTGTSTPVQQSSPIVSFTSEVVSNSTAIETFSETLAPSIDSTSTVESTQLTLTSSSLVTLTSSSVEILSTMTSVIESTVSSSFISLTTSSAIDITTTVASSVETSTFITSGSVFIPTVTVSSDTIDVTISIASSFSSLQPITSTVELTSSPSMVLSSTGFISSTISEVISTTMLPTQTFFTSAEVTPSTIMPNSVVPTTTSPMVSPTPTSPMVSPTPTCSPGTMLCNVLMACIPTTQECPTVPKALITVSAEGGGFLIDEIIQDENNSNQYRFKFGNFINAQNEGTINSELGSLQDSEAFAIPPRINYSSLEGHIIRNKIAPNDPIHVVVQAHNLSILSTSTGSFRVVITVNDINTNYSMQNECTITVNSGYCIGRIDLKGLNNAPTVVSVSVIDMNNSQSRNDAGQVEILEVAERNINNNDNAILMKLTTRTIYPPDDVTVTITSIGYSVKSLLINCSVNNSSASIMVLPKNNWSTLSINNNTENQLAISHERVTEAENEGEEEILCMKINFKDFSADRVEVKCQLQELLLTNRVLVDNRDLNITVLDRNSMRNSSGYIFLGNKSVINSLVAYTNKTVLFNSAVINGELLEYDLVVKGITVTGEVVDLTNLRCTSSNYSVLKVMSDCSRVFLDGMETAGSIATINVYYESLNTTVTLRVWNPDKLVLEAEDTVLNVISNWHESVGCDHRYQQTLFRVFANVSDGTRTINRLDVTSFISDFLISTNESVLKIFPNATVQGVSPGTANVTVNNVTGNTVNLLQFIVSDEPVEAAALEVLLYNNLSVTIPQNIDLYGESYGTVTLTQKSDRAKQLFVNVLFTDSQRMELKQSDYIVNSMCDSIAVRGDLIHPIGNTSGYKECIKVTLVRNDTCNVTDTVEGMANISIQLSTPMNLEIKLSTSEIIADENISLITGISDEITLQAILHFSNGDQIDITSATETNVTTALNMTRLNEILTLSVSTKHKNNEYNITVTNSLYNISNSTSVNVVQGTTVNLSVHPYPEYSNPNSTNINRLSRIGNTDIYQQALLKVMLTLPNGSNYIVTDSAHFEMTPENILTLSSNGTVSVNDNITTDTNVDITARFSSLNSESVTIQVMSERVGVQSIDDVIFVSEFRGVQNSTQFVDASVTLTDGTILLHTYEKNIPLYPGLLNFSVNDTTTASVVDNTVTLLGNSLTDNYITAYAVGQNSLFTNTTFRCDLVAGLHDIDLGTNLSLPIAVDRGDMLESPVHVNSENDILGIFELNVFYSSTELEVVNVVPGEDWATGSLVYQVATINENTDMVSFGGINYQGEKGKSIHVANITFKANTSGTVILNSTIALLAKADLTSELIAEEDRDSTAGSLLMVYVNEKRTRRDVFYDEPPLMSPETEIHSHHKRQSGDSNQPGNNNQDFPGDVNRDGEVDLRDVNYLRHYQVESVYDFASPAGQEILMTHNNTFDSLDVNGDGLINSLDTTELENINFDLLRVINNTMALCSNDNGMCTCIVTGELYTADMQSSPSDDVYILVDFGSTNQSFQHEFNNTFPSSSVLSYKGDGLYGGIVLAEIISESGRTTFVVKTNSSFSTPDIGISLIQITVDANGETSNERQSIHVKSGNVYPNTLNVNVRIPDDVGVINITIENGYSPFINLNNSCSVVVENTISSTMTTVMPTSSLNVSTTADISTTLVTTSATSSLTSTAVLTTTILDNTSIVTSSTSEVNNLTTFTTTITESTSEIDSTSIPSTSSTSETTDSSVLTTTSVASSVSQPSTTTVSEISTATSTSQTSMTSISVLATNSTPIMSVSATTGSQTSPTTTTTTSSASASSTSTTASTSSMPAVTTSATSDSANTTSVVSTTTTSSAPPMSTSIITTSSSTASTSSMPGVTTSTTSTAPSTTPIVPSSTSIITTSSTPTTSTFLTPAVTTSTTNTTNAGSDSSSDGDSTGTVVAVVVILVVIATAVVVVLVICWYRRSKKRKTYYFNPASRPSSGLSSNYWFQEEEKIEMSPIDIVPMAPSPCDEQFRDTVVVPNGIGYRNIGYASGTQRSADGGTKPGYFKPSAESSAGPPPPPYTSRHQRHSTAFDDEVNLSFHDEPMSQAYLSLGLTPLSQLSPPDSQDVGFFPSLPPPIATTVDDHSIPVDGPLFIDDRKPTKRNRRAGLETVPEQPTSPSSSKYSQGGNPLSPFQRSTQPEESLVFPSASISQDYLRTLSNANNRTASPNYGARNFGFSSQYEDDPLIDFNDYGSGYSMHVDSSPESKRNGRNLNHHDVSRDSPPDEHHSQFTRGDLRRQGVKRSRGDLSSQRSSQEMMLRQPIRRGKVYEDDDDEDLTTILVPRPTSPPGVYPPQLSDIHNFTPPVKDQNYGSISSIPSYKEDHHATTLL